MARGGAGSRSAALVAVVATAASVGNFSGNGRGGDSDPAAAAILTTNRRGVPGDRNQGGAGCGWAGPTPEATNRRLWRPRLLQLRGWRPVETLASPGTRVFAEVNSILRQNLTRFYHLFIFLFF